MAVKSTFNSVIRQHVESMRLPGVSHILGKMDINKIVIGRMKLAAGGGHEVEPLYKGAITPDHLHAMLSSVGTSAILQPKGIFVMANGKYHEVDANNAQVSGRKDNVVFVLQPLPLSSPQQLVAQIDRMRK